MLKEAIIGHEWNQRRSWIKPAPAMDRCLPGFDVLNSNPISAYCARSHHGPEAAEVHSVCFIRDNLKEGLEVSLNFFRKSPSSVP